MADKAKRTRKAKAAINVESGTIDFSFLATGGSFHADVHKLPDGIRAQLVLHGLKQKLGDAYADPDQDAESAVREVWHDLVSGTWSTRGEGGPRLTRLAKAVFEVYSGSKDWAESEETVQDYLDSLFFRDGKMFTAEADEDGAYEFEDDKEHKAALTAIRKSPKVKAVLDRLALEDMQKKAAASRQAAETGEDILA